jgi:hypothetical protein
MIPATQQKSRRNLLKQPARQWPSLIRDRLGIFALTLFVLGFILLLLPIGALQGVGGIVFGTGLTVLISTWSNRQQLAKDANLRRKTEVYGPLHAELQNLRERLEEARAHTKPYLQQLDVAGVASLRQLEISPQLQLWPEFKADYRSLDFSEPTRQMLNQVLQLAQDYNTAVDHALEATEAILAPYIKKAIDHTAQQPDFLVWRDSHVHGVADSPPSPQDWFVRIQNALTTPQPPLAEMVWVATWLKGPMVSARTTTLGWLLEGNRDQALHAIYAIYSTPSGGYPPPPREWLQAIIDEAWPTLESHPTYLEVHTLQEKLFQQVSQAEARLLEKLRYIQDTYEGGPPPL